LDRLYTISIFVVEAAVGPYQMLTKHSVHSSIICNVQLQNIWSSI